MTIFDNPTEDNQSPLFTDNTTPTVDETKNYLEELVGDGKKFKTVDDLAKGKAAADLFIEQLKTEKLALENRLREQVTLDDLMKRLEQKTPPAVTPKPEERVDTDVNHLTEAKVLELISNTFSKKTVETQKGENLNKVKQELQKIYGPNYTNKIESIRQELGLSKEQAQDIAATNPNLFLKAFGVSNVPSDISNPPSTTKVLPLDNGQVRNYAYYNQLRKTNKDLFNSQAIQKQMYEDRVKLGDKF